MVPPKPYISLLTNRGIENPFTIFDKFWECSWVAVPLAVCVGKLVFGSEMKHVNWFCSILEMIILDNTLMGIKLAVVVKDEEFWRGLGGWKCGLRKSLNHVKD